MRTSIVNLLVALPFAFALQACVGTPHKSPEDVTASEVAFYKLGISTGCRDAGRSKGDSPEKIESFCGCVAKHFEASLSDGEWKQATFFAQQRRDSDEQRVLGPHMRGLGQCRAIVQ